MGRLENKVAVITGASSGIGRATALLFEREGAKVAGADLDISDPPPGIKAVRCDVSSEDDVERLIETVLDTFGKIDILVNNAGIIRDNVIWRMTEDDFDSVLRVNLKGPWLLSRQIVPLMKSQQSGRIINIASRAWLGNFGQSNYSSSKGGLVSLTRVLALELARYNVTVNAVAPGLIDTPLTKSLPPETYEKLVAAQPGKKAGKPEDIAHAVAFLASDAASFITGEIMDVNGGYLMD